ncbi:ribosomal-protein-alanine N-acetyltransferase [Aggregatibacter actinomycetemcomitans]|uniref:[Ribosomal protein bS18]-alanine N-acetyltransferase n=1 Tax=Aggregatibacter actinomycetemcomitans TaxID=714 RepID=A0A142G261_AGGAC|nr:ribosomal protein S18-alanine N-acetyltransferase [Aggregatibacter actinomycetemcomitans]AFI86444.2 alanine acetyltransferase [Aggregatibacter actinomycetemcomitans D7S-1]KYK96424.1 alanine acetyltransferase [Aggregatibacter actinomycetemcomitans serotype d str. SA3733]ACX83188.1 alanine acetyltransferase [Aggregatibacter actinomycetemcomitans D11S-1]AMQ94741.1 ribosomal-protein-alanine acetyltransferase [Aggregatibacter actinomycetemcomitans]ANU82758.1 ribosomal-protein-alanine N-acetyltra
MIHISPIEPSDFDRLYLIEQAAHAVPWSLGTLKNNQGERYLNLKIGEESRIDGFAICQTVLDEATLFNIAVNPQQQGLGLGRRLLSELMTQLKQKSILTLWLEVRESNKKAQALYDSLGFNQVDIRKNYYPTPDGKRENAVVMAAYL